MGRLFHEYLYMQEQYHLFAGNLPDDVKIVSAIVTAHQACDKCKNKKASGQFPKALKSFKSG